jgi:hypothetical protein
MHFHADHGPTHFAKVILAPGLEMHPIPPGFRPYLITVRGTIILKMNNGCSWMVNLKGVNGATFMDQWRRFSIAHDIKID